MLNIYTMYDSKAQVYMAPFVARTDAEATRMVAETMSNPQHGFYRFAEDYALYGCGTFNPETGELQKLAVYSVVGCWSLKAAMKGEE